MKVLIKTMMFVALVFGTASCSSDDEKEDSKMGVSTMNVTDITSYSAIFNGKLFVSGQIGSDFEFGFELSESQSFDDASTTRYNVEVYSGNDKTFTYALVGGLSVEHTYYVRAYMFNLKSLYYGDVKSFKTLKRPDVSGKYVDLGLSVKWADCNIGATTPEGYGDYYAWGETSTKETYNWETYQWCNGSSEYMTKYCIDGNYGKVDNKTNLELADDVAHVKWGGKWRMPTREEIDELLDEANTTITWTTQKGINGIKVTSKKNGNSIFLPAAADRWDGYLNSVGSSGKYWSSSLLSYGDIAAYNLSFSSGYWNCGCIYCRSDGQSVRAVCP